MHVGEQTQVWFGSSPIQSLQAQLKLDAADPKFLKNNLGKYFIVYVTCHLENVQVLKWPWLEKASEMDLTCAFTLGKSPNLSESPILSSIDCGYFSASPGYCENKCKKLGNKYEYLL